MGVSVNWCYISIFPVWCCAIINKLLVKRYFDRHSSFPECNKHSWSLSTSGLIVFLNNNEYIVWSSGHLLDTTAPSLSSHFPLYSVCQSFIFGILFHLILFSISLFWSGVYPLISVFYTIVLLHLLLYSPVHL